MSGRKIFGIAIATILQPFTFIVIILSPLIFVAIDFAWGIYTGQVANNGSPYLNGTLHKTMFYGLVFAMPVFAFYMSKNQKLWFRICLSLTSAILMWLWALWWVIIYHCKYGTCI